MSSFDYSSAWAQAIELPGYWNEFQVKLENPEEGDAYAPYLPMNWQRIQRIYKHFTLSSSWESWVSTHDFKSYWLVITEPWCGDAAQIVPVLDLMAQASGGKIDIRAVYRDQNLKLMDRHLTNGSRSIPKIICLNSDYQYLGEWGPRPSKAQALREQFSQDPKQYADALHLWYGRNKQVAIQAEVGDWMKSLV